MNTSDLTKIKHDGNGNPRYVCSFYHLLTENEKKTLTYKEMYKLAAKRANGLDGRKFDTKQYPGHLVFQCFNTNELVKKIAELLTVQK